MNGATRILIVDDNASLLRIYERMLGGLGYEIDLCLDGEQAERAISERSYDVILSDINMPKLDGMELLGRVRARDPHVPVVLITGSPELDTAIRAVEQGALRYLRKPLKRDDLRKVTEEAVRAHAVSRAKQEAVDLAGGVERLMVSRETLGQSFERAFAGLHVAYQPIVSWSRREVYGYEALLRSREPSLPNPLAVIDAAERLGRVHDLGRRVRELAAASMKDAPAGTHLFVNLHPRDLVDEELFDAGTALAREAPRVVLEITERASLRDVPDVEGKMHKLRSLGFRIAVDDLGAGYAGLTSFAHLGPEVTKLDMSLVRDVHRQPTKLTLARTMLTMCAGMNILVVAEGIETAEERDALASAGCDLMQGYFFAKPGAPFPTPSFR